MNEEQKIFDKRLSLPDPDIARRLERLVGLDDVKSRLTNSIGTLINPAGISEWANKFHEGEQSIVGYVERRPPLIILAGDVGTGKTEIAETIGDAVARQESVNITLLPLSLSTRGSGRVGEMTALISAAFDEVYTAAKPLSGKGSKSRGGVIMLVDEGDALTQSRENSQMHHEDKAGVNAFIRGVDRLSEQHLPAAVILCTNRLGSIDPAVRRRAADIFEFTRPNNVQRRSILGKPLKELGFTEIQINQLVNLTGAKGKSSLGFTYSDLTHRFLPALVLDAYPDKPVTFKRSVQIIKNIKPTPSFKE